MRKDITVKFPVRITKFKQHDLLKDKLLNAINSQEVGISRIHDEENDVTRCDWGIVTWDKKQRDWVDIISSDLYDHIMDWCIMNDYDRYHINEIWFQQYIKGGHHAWHVHGSNFTNVYYLDLPKDSPKTQWKDLLGNEGEFDVEEGDIITFPSWLKHKSPENNSSEMKTIISWNMDVLLEERY